MPLAVMAADVVRHQRHHAKVPGEFLLDERLQRHHESLVLGTSLKFAALASELAVDELAIRRHLKGASATWFASDGAALDVGLQLHLQSIEGGLVASGTTVFDVDNERHVRGERLSDRFALGV